MVNLNGWQWEADQTPYMEDTLTDPPPTLFERWNYMILPFCGSYAFGSKSPERKDLYIQNHHGQRIPQQKDALNNFGSLFVKFTPSRPRFAPKSLIRVYKRWQGWLWRGSGVWAIKWQLLSGFRVEPHARAPCDSHFPIHNLSEMSNCSFVSVDGSQLVSLPWNPIGKSHFISSKWQLCNRRASAIVGSHESTVVGSH